MTTSSLVRIDETVPALAVNPLWKTTTASVCLNVGEPALELHVDVHRAGDRAHRSRADAVAVDRLERALAQPRMRRQPEVVVRREVDDLPVVDRRLRLLLVVEDAEMAVEALRFERVELGRTES